MNRREANNVGYKRQGLVLGLANCERPTADCPQEGDTPTLKMFMLSLAFPRQAKQIILRGKPP